MKNISKSFDIAKQFLGKEVEVIIDRELGSAHPEFGFIYEVNYGYVQGVKMPDGEDLDCYCLGWDKPMAAVRGKAVAIVHRLDDDDDKLVVVAPGFAFDKDIIGQKIIFQEKYFRHELVFEFIKTGAGEGLN